MKRLVFILGVALLSLFGAPQAAWAEDWTEGAGVSTSVTQGSCVEGHSFFLLRPWYYGLKCEGKNVSKENFETENMEDSIKSIILVVIYDIMIIVGILATGFLIYGGYQYIYSGGDSAKASRGKKTIQTAIVGMVIALISTLAVNTFGKLVLSGAEKAEIAGQQYQLFDIAPEDMIGTIMNFVLALATLTAVGFIIYSGVLFMTAYGDTAKTAKARKGIMYSVAGLIIALVASGIVNFVLGGLSKAMPSGADSDLFAVVNNIFGVVLGVAGLVATIGVIVGGLYYLTSTGDTGRMQKGKNAIMYSLIGLIVVFVAGGVISFILNAVFAS